MGRWALVALTLCIGSPAWAGVVVSSSGLLSVEAKGSRLGSLLAEINGLIPLEMVLLDPAVAPRPVTISLRAVPLESALPSIFEAAGVNYAVMGRKMYAGDRDAAVPLVPAAAAIGDVAGAPEAGKRSPRSVEPDDAEETEPEVDLEQYAAEQQEHFDALLKAMAPVDRSAPSRTITLPFPESDGTLRTMEVTSAPDGKVAVPIPGPDGEPIRVPVDRSIPPQPPPSMLGTAAPSPPVEARPEPPPDR